ncbi:hypothetical protein RvY_10612 [Ramazzottius varieornatus]|uniref:CTLH domain-containing protein n=1 Tax=Ramazzottius varieornatus TaxID=947166 RepID=A0A1D1VDB6_RAMVA|nr:hypothetical protein RvY_10612 [Ramazzottius varieornatus]
MVIKPNSTTANGQVNLTDKDIILLILDFLEAKNLNISQIALERETGIVNGHYSEEVLFLRNLIVEGAWDDAVDYVEPLTQADNFDYTFFKKIIHRYKYLELLCIKNEVGNTKFNEQAAVGCLRDLESLCDKAELNEYRLLLTYPSIQQHPDYHDWNPSSARIKCFREVRPLVEEVLQTEKTPITAEVSQSPPGRLINLLIKGILYETASRLCTQRAKKGSDDLRFSSLLPRMTPNLDMTLLSWLQSIPTEAFTYQFEEKTLPLNYRELEKPLLEATWTELIQQTPIRLHSGAPRESGDGVMTASARVAVNDRMVQSMVEQMDGFRRRSSGFNSQSARHKSLSQSFHLGMSGQEDPLANDMFSSPRRHQSPVISRSARPDLSTSVTHGSNSGSTAGASQGDTSQLYLGGGIGGVIGGNMSQGEPLSPISESADSEMEEVEGRGSMEKLQSNLQEERLKTAEARNREENERKKVQDEWEERERQRQLLMAQILEPTISPRKVSSPGSKGNGTALSAGKSSPASQPEVTHQVASSGQPSAQKTSSRLGEGSVAAAVKDDSSRNGSSVGGDLTPTKATPSSTDDGRRGSIGRTDFFGSMAEGSSFVPVQFVRDTAAIRCAAFHPSGDFYAVGSNSQVLRVCAYPSTLMSSRLEGVISQPATIVDQRHSHHKSSVFCVAWNATGNLIATGSNDKALKLVGFDTSRQAIIDKNVEMRVHNDTIRDVIFVPHSGNEMLVSGGADKKIVVTDCGRATAVKEYSEHTAAVLSLYSWGRSLFVSGSGDKTCRLWDLRQANSTKVIHQKNGCPGSPVTCTRVDSTGSILASVHESGHMMIWDLRGDRVIQVAQVHPQESRGLSIRPQQPMLLTASYDKTVLAHDIAGELFAPLPTVLAAAHSDKVIQCHFHPTDFSFITTSADKTCVLWGYPWHSTHP